MTRYMKLAAAMLVAAGLAGASALASGDNWMTDFPAAQAKAKSEKKLLLMDFTGKGWCGWCTKLNKEVFATPEFQKYAADNLVLLELDFQQPGKLDAKLEKQNQALAQKYGVQGFPTIVVLNGSGKKVGELGYQPGGPGPFIAELKKMQGGS